MDRAFADNLSPSHLARWVAVACVRLAHPSFVAKGGVDVVFMYALHKSELLLLCLAQSVRVRSLCSQ